MVLSEEDSERLREILAALPPDRTAIVQRVALVLSLMLLAGLIALAVWYWDELRALIGHLEPR